MQMWHWQTGMDEAELIDLTVDWDNADGLNDPDAGIGVFRSHYRYAGLTSTPAAAIDESSAHLYLTYTMPIEYTDIYGDPLNLSAQSYRDIFGVFSADGGGTWSTPVNLTNTAETGKENIYLFTHPKVVGGKVHAVWQRDDLPGTTITDLDPIDTNWIMYNAWDIADFGDIAPGECTAVAGPGGLYADAITSSSATMHWDAVSGAEQYVLAFWNAADIETVGKKRPSTNMWVIPEGKLAPGTTYGFRVKTVCYEEGIISPYSATSYFTTLLKMGEFSKSVMVYPNPTDGNFNLQLNGYENDGAQIMIVNSIGQIIYQNNIVVEGLVHTQNIDLTNMPSGLYRVIVSNNGSSVIKTLMVE